ncbi:MAG TPA: type II toxin-antitoxin system RelE/ParE family toxin [Stellaceae bacterium]|jgi:proteic killer suppression protein
MIFALPAQRARNAVRRQQHSQVPAQHAKRLRLIVAALETSSVPEDMNLTGMRLHALKGSRKGEWAVWVSRNWRIVFEFDGRNVTNVDLVDYH